MLFVDAKGILYKPEECFEYMGSLPERFEQISFPDGPEQQSKDPGKERRE